MQLKNLKTLIHEAFADVEYPGDDNIAGCSRSLTPIGCDDCDPLAAHFKGTTWQEHNLQTLAGFDGIGFFHTEARHYYLPAYMLAEIENRRLADIHFRQYEESEEYEKYPDPLPNLNISYSFLPSQHESIQQERKNFLGLFSPQQRRAVVEYLKYSDIFEGVYEPDKDTLEAIASLENG